VIGKQAPAWTAQAVIEGEFKTISLADFQVRCSTAAAAALRKCIDG